MTRDDYSRILAGCLEAVGPGIDTSGLVTSARLRDQLPLGAADLRRFVDAVRESTGLAIPESEYHRFETLEGALGYLVSRAHAA